MRNPFILGIKITVTYTELNRTEELENLKTQGFEGALRFRHFQVFYDN